jgi:hypothetical protein
MLPANSANQIPSADGKVIQIAAIRNDRSFKEMIDPDNSNSTVKAGDIVQMDFASSTPHTMLITKIESDGIWVVDTNFGPYTEILLADAKHPGTLFENPLNPGTYISPSDAIKLGIPVPAELRYYSQPDDTIRYHFMFFDSLDKNVNKATIYRVIDKLI